MSLQNIKLKEEYRSDSDDIFAEFFLPCLSNCTEYNRCVDFLSIQTLVLIAMTFNNFVEGKAKLKMITGYKFKTSDLDLLAKLFSAKHTKFNGDHIHNVKIQKLQEFVDNGQIELKIAIPNSDEIVNSFSERIGIFRDELDNIVAFTGTSGESLSAHPKDFESVDVFTSWNDRSRVERKIRDFEELWKDKTKYVDVYDFVYAEKNGLLKYSAGWVLGY